MASETGCIEKQLPDSEPGSCLASPQTSDPCVTSSQSSSPDTLEDQYTPAGSFRAASTLTVADMQHMGGQHLHPPLPCAAAQVVFSSPTVRGGAMEYNGSYNGIGAVQYIPVQCAPVVRCYPVIMLSGQHAMVQQQCTSLEQTKVHQGICVRSQTCTETFTEQSEARLVTCTVPGRPPGQLAPGGAPGQLLPGRPSSHIMQAGHSFVRHVLCTQQPTSAQEGPTKILTELSSAEARALRMPQVEPPPQTIMRVATMVAAVPVNPRSHRYAAPHHARLHMRPNSAGAGAGALHGTYAGPPIHHVTEPHGMRRQIIRQLQGANTTSRASSMLHDSFATVSDLGVHSSPMASVEPTHHPSSIPLCAPPPPAIYHDSQRGTGSGFKCGQNNRPTAIAANPYIGQGTRECPNPFAMRATNPFAGIGRQRSSSGSLASSQTTGAAAKPLCDDASTVAVATSVSPAVQDQGCASNVISQEVPSMESQASNAFSSPAALSQQPRGDSAEVMLLHVRNAIRASSNIEETEQHKQSSEDCESVSRVLKDKSPSVQEGVQGRPNVLNSLAGAHNSRVPPKLPSRLAQASSAASMDVLRGAVTASQPPFSTLQGSLKAVRPCHDPQASVIDKDNVPRSIPRKKGVFQCFRPSVLVD